MFINSIHSPISLLSVFFPIIAVSHSDNDPLKNYYWIIVDLQYCFRFVVQQSESLNIHIYPLFFFFFLDSFPMQVITEY